MYCLIYIFWYIFFADFIVDILNLKKIPILKKSVGLRYPPSHRVWVYSEKFNIDFLAKNFSWLPNMYRNSPRMFRRKTQCKIFHGRPVLSDHVFRGTLKRCRKWHILLNLATKFKFRHASTLGEGHLGQRWRIWDTMSTHNNFSEKKSTSLNPMTLNLLGQHNIYV